MRKPPPIILLLGAFSSYSWSYGSYTGQVSNVRIDRDGRGIIAFAGEVGHEPASCRAQPYTAHMSFDANTEGGKAIYAMALAAVASGKPVSAIGLGECLEYSGTVESLSYWIFLSE